MRFDEFVAENAIAVSPVDRFDEFVVDVELPSDWDPFGSAVGIGVWICRTDPCSNEFCANAVLTLHRVETSLNTGEVFAMLSEQQLQSTQGCRELHRELTAATEGPGAAGVLAMQISHELGIIDSVSRSRILTTDKETLISQLTVTALQNSPVNREDAWPSVRLRAASDASTSNFGGTPVGRILDSH